MLIGEILAWSSGPALLLVLAYLAVWWAQDKRPPLVTHLGQSLAKLRAFWGKRVGDKKFMGMLSTVIAGGAGTYLAPAEAQLVLLILTLAGAFLFPTWEDLPFETLDTVGPGAQPNLHGGPVTA